MLATYPSNRSSSSGVCGYEGATHVESISTASTKTLPRRRDRLFEGAGLGVSWCASVSASGDLAAVSCGAGSDAVVEAATGASVPSTSALDHLCTLNQLEKNYHSLVLEGVPGAPCWNNLTCFVGECRSSYHKGGQRRRDQSPTLILCHTPLLLPGVAFHSVKLFLRRSSLLEV